MEVAHAVRRDLCRTCSIQHMRTTQPSRASKSAWRRVFSPQRKRRNRAALPLHTARYDRCCEEEERICKLAGSQKRFETYRICKLAGSQERFETQGRTRARVQCPAPSPAPTPDTISTIRVTAHAS